MPTIAELREHIVVLCLQWEITVSYCDRPAKAWGARELEEICIAPVRSVISYAAALHEIGHVRGRYQQSPKVEVRERDAWRWARTNAMIWTPRMERSVPQPYRTMNPAFVRV